MDQSFDLQTLGQRIRLPLRTLRYVVDHRLLPGMRGRLQKHLVGRPRSFTTMEAFFVGLAGLLLHAGMKGQLIVQVMSWLLDMPWPIPGSPASTPTAQQRVRARPRSTAEALYYWACEPTTLFVGDGGNLRFRIGTSDTGWFEPRSLAQLEQSYHPRTFVQVDLGRFWTELHSPDRSIERKPTGARRRSEQKLDQSRSQD